MKITLRQRKKGDKISLYLEYYNNGNRDYEYLKLYLIPEPEKGRLTPQQKESNRKNLELAEAIKSKRHLEIQNGIYGFYDKEKMRSSFLKYFEQLSNKRNDSAGNLGNWKSALKHLQNYVNGDVSFEQVTKSWIEGFKDYLQSTKGKSDKPLSANSQFSYYSKVVAALKQAVKDGIITRNPSSEVDNIKQAETQREFLTLDELKAAVDAKCDNEFLKRAFLFSALTGLRWSDVIKLKWSEVQHSKENGYYLRYQQEKTGAIETLPISDDARSFLGETGQDKEVVFPGLKYSAWNNLKLREWMMRAGVVKSITFHCARHTFATLQLTAGTDIFTVSKMLGHKNLKNTQIYTKIIDEKKIEAANRISLGLKSGK
jgi:site-specific recombinase XerD